MNILVIDVGGTNVKVLATGQEEPRKFESHKGLTPQEMVQGVKEMTGDWTYEAVSLGIPGPVNADGAEEEPGNLGDGWIDFHFEEAFGKPVRVINDAAMQALGAYDDGRMLFLGLGTGLGSALVTDSVIVPLELGNLPYRPGVRLSDKLGRKGLEKLGRKKWLKVLTETTASLKAAFKADTLVLGGGNVELVKQLPEGTRRGSNADAFTGGFRLWSGGVDLHEPAHRWRVVR